MTNDPSAFAMLRQHVTACFMAATHNQEPLFTTDADTLYDLYLTHLPADQQQHHTCHACRRFIERYGGLVVLDTAGQATSAFWQLDGTPEPYRAAVAAMQDATTRARVTGVFMSHDRVWGTPVTGDWTHLAVASPHVFDQPGQTAEQACAEKREDYGTLCRALADFTPQMLDTAVGLLTSETLYRAERVLGVATWLQTLQQRRTAAPSATQRHNLTWAAVASAPAGFCHPRSTMIGTLLDDIANGLSFAQVQARFASKMNPAQYQRAQTAPSAGTIAQAERLFADLKLAAALPRRYAQLQELPPAAFVWSPPPTAPASADATAGLFGHLQPKPIAPAAMLTPTGTLTWEKFARTVLPTAQTLAVCIPPSPERFMALVTAAQADAPPILQWDREAQRNPFSWYYAGGIDAEMRRRLVRAGGQFEDVDLRFSLMWHNENDLDLHVLTPTGEHIYYSNKMDRQRVGFLDVDMNVSGESREPVENTRWGRGQAPEGRYQVLVNLYGTHRGNGTMTRFTVEMEVDGQVVTRTGVTQHANSSDALRSMVPVADFIYQRGRPTSLTTQMPARTVAVSPNVWDVMPGTYVPVTAIVRSPNLWNDPPLEQHGTHAFVLLDGCRDTQAGVGRGFFTEMLHSTLHPVRSVLDTFVASAPIDGAQEASCCGIGINTAATGNLTLRVTSAAGSAQYLIDRWD